MACTLSTSERHLEVQKWSKHLVFCRFWVGNVLRATTACTFSTSQLPKVLRTWRALTLFTSKRASRHNGVQLFNSLLAKWLRTRCFSAYSSTLWSHKTLEKQSVSRLSDLFAHLHFLSSVFLPFWSSPSLIFSCLTFSISEPIPGFAFPSVHTVGSLVSKLRSTNNQTVQACCIMFLMFAVCSVAVRKGFSH